MSIGRVATPVNWKQGEDVIIAGSVFDDVAKKTYPQAWKAPKPLYPHRAATAVNRLLSTRVRLRAGWEQFGAPGSGYSRLSARAFPNSAPSRAMMASAINRFPRKLK